MTQVHNPLPWPEGMLVTGLGRLHVGVGIPGPYGQVPAQVIPAGTYEISGTDVAFRSQPNLSDSNPPRTNVLDQIETDGQTANAAGYTWVHGIMKTGPLAGQAGYVAALYLAPVGWTAQRGGGGGGGGGITPVTFVQPVSKTTTTTTTTIEKSFFEDNWPYFLGALAVGGIAFALFGTRKGKAVRRLARKKARKYRRNRRRGKR